MRTRIWLLALAMSLCASAAVAKPPALPQVIVEDAQGSSVDLRQQHSNVFWVLVVVDEAWAQSVTVLQELDRAEPLAGRERVALVISTLAFNAAEFDERFPNLKGRGYYLDKGQALGPLLQLPAFPAVLAINPEGGIAWRHHGGMQPASRLRGLLETWAERPVKGQK